MPVMPPYEPKGDTPEEREKDLKQEQRDRGIELLMCLLGPLLMILLLQQCSG